MDQFIEEMEPDDLNFILCFYLDNVIYHDYDKNTDCLKTGSMLTMDALKAIFNFVNKNPDLKVTEYGFNSIIPANVLQFSNKSKSIIWFTPEQEKTLLYIKRLPVATGKYRIPAMLWKLNSTSLSVFALSSIDKISEKTKLHYAPFFNVASSGAVCMGSAHFENKHTDYSMIMKDVEVKFFNSYFTHSQNNLMLKKTNFVNYCNDVVNKNTFDNSLLVDNKKTIKNLL